MTYSFDDDTTGDASVNYLIACDAVSDAAAELRDELEAVEIGFSGSAAVVAAGLLAVAAADLVDADQAFRGAEDRRAALSVLRYGRLDLADCVQMLADPAVRLATGGAFATVGAAVAVIEREAASLGGTVAPVAEAVAA